MMILKGIAVLTLSLLICLLWVGCSSNPADPVNTGVADISQRDESTGGRVIWGVYRFMFNADTGLIDVQPNRELEAHFNVTGYVTPPNCSDCVKITSSQYKPLDKEWTFGVSLKNPSMITGYDVRGLVRNLGNKWLINSDGYMDKYLGEELSFRAFAKSEPSRGFPPQATFPETYIFHYPPGAGWTGIDYIVDASWPGNCKEPYIEDISFPSEIDKGPQDSPLTAVVYDHQDTFIAVLADLSPIGGDANTAMFDDGQHGDGGADDGVFGVKDIVATSTEGDYIIKLRAFDGGSHTGYNSFHVKIKGALVNYDPIIDDITISRTTCLKGSTTEKVTLKCIAHDPNEDFLYYSWSADAGSFDHESTQTTVWTPPDEVGKFNIKCVVTDGEGGEAEGLSPKIRVTQYAIIPPAPVPNLTIGRLLNMSTFKLYDYVHTDVVVTNFFST